MKIVFSVIACLLYSCVFSQQLLKKEDYDKATFDTNSIIVKFKTGQKPKPTYQSISLKTNNPAKPSVLDGITEIQIPPGMDAVDFCNQMIATGGIEYAEPIITYQLLNSTSDPLFTQQYYLNNINALEAWGITRGDDDITIAIIDSGIDLDHSDLADNLWTNDNEIPDDGIDNDNNGYVDDYYGYDFADGDNNPEAEFDSHGVIVAGVAGAINDNNIGIAGLGYNTKIAALKGFRSSTGRSNNLYEAILYAANNGMQVANLSWGAIRSPSQYEQDVINYAVLEKNMVIVASAGNEGSRVTREEKFYPASYDNVLSVAATDVNDLKWSGSTFNYFVDLSAPGKDIVSTSRNNGFNGSGGSGTSFSGPMVAATAALVMDQFPDLTAQQVMERVRITSDDIYQLDGNSAYTDKLGAGRLNMLNALTESNVRSMRASQFEVKNQWGEVPAFGDSVFATLSVTNFLAPIVSTSVRISDPENETAFISNQQNIPSLGSLKNTELAFSGVLGEAIEPNEAIEWKIDIADENSYEDFQYVTFDVAPDYQEVGNDNYLLTVAGNGNIGYADELYTVGTGLRVGGKKILDFAGIMLATNADSVSDNLINSYENAIRSEDFSTVLPFKRYWHPAVDYFGYSELRDPLLQIKIEQSVFTDSEAEAIILKYRLTNESDKDYTALKAGFYADFDLSDKAQNKAQVAASNNFMFTSNVVNDSTAGVLVIGEGNESFSAIDVGSTEEVQSDLTEEITDEIKYNLLSNTGLQTAGGSAGNDVAQLSGKTLSLGSKEAKIIYVILSAANNLASLETNFESAKALIQTTEDHPRVFETIQICDPSLLSITAENSDEFKLYEDPGAQKLLYSGVNFQPKGISNDTSFYISTIKNGISSDIFELRVQLFNEIASFSVPTDTIYVEDDESVISFTDQSQEAVSWSWDFGQGTQSTIQNPRIAFPGIGQYQVSLTVTNNLGCSDSMTKTIVVASRPDPPSFSLAPICEGSSVLLADPDADLLQVYSFESQSVPSITGKNIQIENLKADTTLFVSAKYDGLESQKTAIEIEVFEIRESILLTIDTTSAEHQVIFSSFGEDEIINWQIDGIDQGSEPSIAIAAAEQTFAVSLEVRNAEGCQKIIEKEFSFSSSVIPQQADLIFCDGTPTGIVPSNGTIFGFYQDPELNNLIKKGSSLVVNEESKVFIVGLDDGLPSKPLEVLIRQEEYAVAITYDLTELNETIIANLVANSEQQLGDVEWIVNGVVQSTSHKTTLILDDEKNEIVLQSISEFGCTASDTLLLDFSEVPLAVTSNSLIQVYPNPAQDHLFISTSKVKNYTISIVNLNGQLVAEYKTERKMIDVSTLPKGLYLLLIDSEDDRYSSSFYKD